jgi:hypothetical protein
MHMCIMCGVPLEAGEELVCTLHAAQVIQVVSTDKTVPPSRRNIEISK